MKIFLFLLLFPTLCFSQSIVSEVNLLFKQKQFAKAEQIASNYVSENPNDIDAIELLADAYGYQKKMG